MGHKVHPIGFRLGVIKDWQSKWYSEAHYAEFVLEDNKLRETIKSKYPDAAISLVEIERQAKDVTITLHTARPGIVIGRGGSRVDEMRQYLEGLIGKKIRLNIQEIRQPELDAYLVARSVAEQIERRVAYRRAMKQAIFRTIQSGAKGIKISAAGRLANAEIARRQTQHEGQVPLHTLRADIDYGFTEAHTTLGRIGVKVWIYKGQVLPEMKIAEAEVKPAETAEEPTEAAAVAEKPAEAVGKTAEVAEAKEKPAKEAAAAEIKEKPAKAAKAASVKAEEKPEKETAVAETKEKPAKAAKATPVKAEEKPEKETAAAEIKEKPVKAAKAASVKAEEKPAKPRAKRETKITETKKTEAKEVKTKETKSKDKEDKAEEKKTAPKKSRKTATTAEEKPKAAKKTKTVAKSKEEEKDATA
ncbi:MAG: 30S ribosomal protein S3 [Chloroflexi bacterium RBG_13_51_18]|nr:MAG: 30S ribosomal protein S3 [Chloroflexi bacterium RBG_13_51_18]